MARGLIEENLSGHSGNEQPIAGVVNDAIYQKICFPFFLTVTNLILQPPLQLNIAIQLSSNCEMEAMWEPDLLRRGMSPLLFQFRVGMMISSALGIAEPTSWVHPVPEPPH